MPRPAPRTITFTIDGLEVQAPENSMLVDAAKHGDIEIPVFCYEPKLGNPVGACRMCLVEIEGIPKLQTGCSTPVKDGMVVHTQSERVKVAQNSVVEFLLINHPLDCPVCDKGGECPLQDITFGWGRGISRYVDPKRHFVKPLALSPLIAIDRERCILCYRCVRFSQEISEDHQLVLQERGAHSYVSTFDGHPYVAPFSGNIVELCPVGALTSQPYRFRARPWDIEDAGSVCTLCPSQCNVTLTVRDERVLRVLSRANPEVDDGWLCDRGRFAYPALGGDARVTAPLVRDGGELRPVSWERALEEAAAGLRRAGERVGALAGGGATCEEGLLLARLVREVLGSPHLDSRVAGALPLELLRALAEPSLQATVSDLEFAHAVLLLDCEPVADAAILDLRLRKGVRRHGLRLVPAGRAQLLDQAARAQLLDTLRAAGEEVVVLWHERLGAGAEGERAVRALLDLAATLGLAGIDGAGLLEVPAHTNGRGLREAGVLPNAGPELGELDEGGLNEGGLDAQGIATALAAGELSALYLLDVDPLAGPSPLPSSEHLRSPWAAPEPELWERALERASTVIAHATFLTEGVRAHANVVFPALAYAEKEGTVVHPDGRVQRLRPGVARPGETRDERRVLDELTAMVAPVAVGS
ncbi:MAG TPA: NADH-quinone oxidoreductase subunit NuoG [Solirubrobacteraceae bacterium]|jgi:NADH-quinone oxidoreductase subunit G|nr:NADH-quinone oxidoreductase subunit NuoG [Solirubrobacteraceae bacterium]